MMQKNEKIFFRKKKKVISGDFLLKGGIIYSLHTLYVGQNIFKVKKRLKMQTKCHA